LTGRVVARELPAAALLQRYREAGAYTDCWTLDIDRTIDFAQYVEAFYTTWVFKLERAILAAAVAKPSSDAQARELANGNAEAFAAWTVEARAPDQLLLCDYRGQTRSWLMLEALAPGRRLYFGSAVVPRVDARSGEKRLGPTYAALLGFHRLYSRVLLRAAAARLR
jgi:hypothetical protein